MSDSETSMGIEMTISREERKIREKEEYEARLKDPIMGSIGQMGWWQIWVCVVIVLLKFPVGWHQMAIIFLAPLPDFKCAKPSTADKCGKECIEVDFNRTIFTETIITQFKLICDKEQLANLSQTIFMLGILIGSVVFGIWADKLGRRNPLVIAVVIQVIAAIATAASPWYWLFTLLRFITGVATGGTMCTSFVIVMEIIGPKFRELISVLYQIPFNLGHLSLPLFSYLLRDWRHFQLAISVPSVVLLSYYWLVPESPRWLYTAGRIDEAVKILERAARQNRLPIEHIRSDLEEAAKRKQASATGESSKKGNLLDLFKTRNMCKKSLIMIFVWFVCGLAFFGVAQYIGALGGNIFVNVAISASLELPGTITCIFMMKYLGRKIILIFSCALTGVALLCIAFVPEDKKWAWAIVGLASVGTIGMSICFPCVYLYGGEIFPTVVRNIGLGLCSVSARVGSMIAPFIVGLKLTNHIIPPIIFGIVPLIGAALAFFLPETKGFTLPETISDGEEFGKKKPPA